jgi:hypothetical protein
MRNMKIIKEKFKKDARTGFYWGRVYFISDNRDRKARILWGFSLEFARKKLEKDIIDKDDIEHIINAVVNKWKAVGNSVFKPSFHYDAFASGAEEKQALLDLLSSNDKV